MALPVYIVRRNVRLRDFASPPTVRCMVALFLSIPWDLLRKEFVLADDIEGSPR